MKGKDLNNMFNFKKNNDNKLSEKELKEIEQEIYSLRDEAHRCIQAKDFIQLSIVGKELRRLKKKLEKARKND